MKNFDLKNNNIENILNQGESVKLQMNDLVNLGVEIWRLKNRLEKYNLNLEEDQKKIIENSFFKIEKYLGYCEVSIKDYTNSKFSEELNIDPISFESDDSLKYPIIKETIEPQVSVHNKVYRKSKVIVAKP